MKKLLFCSFLLMGIGAISQKVDMVTYEQLTNPEQAKFISKKIDFEAIQMPDGSTLRVGDLVQLGEPFGEKQRKYSGVMEKCYSTIKYGGSYRPGFAFLPETDDEDPEYVFAVDKGAKAKIYKFKPMKKLDGTFYTGIIIKTEDEESILGRDWNRARASLESFEKGELVKI